MIDYALVVAVGVSAGVGAVVGLAASALTARFDDHLLEITLTTIAAYARSSGRKGCMFRRSSPC